MGPRSSGSEPTAGEVDGSQGQCSEKNNAVVVKFEPTQSLELELNSTGYLSAEKYTGTSEQMSSRQRLSEKIYIPRILRQLKNITLNCCICSPLQPRNQY